MGIELDELDRRLLDALQRGLPLVREPFAALAERLGAESADLAARARRLKNGRIIRQVSAIFDTAALGYQSSLVAARCAADRIDAAAAVVSRHPGVSHNYQRDCEYNLWYTIAVPPTSRLGLKRTVEALHIESAAEATRLMPTLKLFKIGVRLAMSDEGVEGSEGGEGGQAEAPAAPADAADKPPASPPTEREIAMIRLLQADLPLVDRPFDALAAGGGVSPDELLASAAALLADGRMRRFAAVLHHRSAGYSANAMGVWAVEEARIEEVGRRLAGFQAVSHCYQRPSWPDWPFNLYTMVHARSREAALAELDTMQRAVAVGRMRALFSTKEYKKSRVRYFTGEIEAWEAGRI